MITFASYRSVAAALASLCLLTGCGDAAVSGSYATPEDTIRTFFAAAKAKDKDLLSSCFSKSRDEFKEIIDKTMSDEKLQQASEMFGTGSIVKTEKGASENQVAVEVKLPGHPRGEESMTMIKEGDVWRILDF
ncbi:MAG: hypothetical protein AB8H80_17925 [Planctomycetota bacterium]